ncbi:MAG: hypothetical protein WC143_08190 [Eubacteriales bacterium]|jgi:hypothetical protein|nr:hypothetical protein [Clostridia bacterium]
MSNIGVGETYCGIYIEQGYISKVDSLLGNTLPVTTLIGTQYIKTFKYRYLTSSEMLTQPISGWVKNKYEDVIFTSENSVDWKTKSLIYTQDGKRHILENKLPQRQHGMFLISQKFPHILELV